MRMFLLFVAWSFQVTGTGGVAVGAAARFQQIPTIVAIASSVSAALAEPLM